MRSPANLLIGLSCALTASAWGLPLDAAWAQAPGAPAVQLISPAQGACVPNLITSRPGGAPGEVDNFSPSEVPLRFVLTEPNGDAAQVSVTVNGAPVLLNNTTAQVSAAGVPEEISTISVDADSISDGVGLSLTVTVTSPAGTASDTVVFDLDRLPPSLVFTPNDLALLGLCDANAGALLAGVLPVAIDAQDPSPTLEVSTSDLPCSLTRVFVTRDHCGAGNSQDIFFSMARPSPTPADIYFSGAEDDGRYLEVSAFYGVATNPECFNLSADLTSAAGAAIMPSGTYLDEPGAYSLAVTATDCANNTVTESIDFTLIERPKARAGGPYALTQGGVITLDASASTCPPELGGISEYAWDLNLDDARDGYSALGRQVTFPAPPRPDQQPLDDGVYAVGLRITTAQGQVDYDFVEVTINDALPACDAGGPYAARQGEYVTFDATASAPGVATEPLIGYEWHFGDGEGPFSQEFGYASVTPRHFYEQEGEFTVSLTVYDIDSTCETTATVVVEDVEPVVSGLRVTSAPPYVEGQTLTFSAGNTSAGGDAAVEPLVGFSWDWDDGTPPTTSTGGVELRNPSHQFLDSGAFSVCLTVDDGDSLATGCLPVEVVDLAPRPRLTGDTFAFEGDEAFFSIAGTRAGGVADPLTILEVDWGDGVVERLEDLSVTDLSHVFVADGDLVVTLRAFDEDSEAVATWPIYVEDVSPSPRVTLLSGPPEEGIPARWSAAQSVPGAPSDPITYYKWEFGDGAVLEGPNLVEVEHAWADNRTYSLRLTLSDSDEQSASAVTQLVQVANRPPFNASIVTESGVVDLGDEVRFEVRFEDVLSDTVSIYWRMGEGTEYRGRSVVTHAYQELGIFTVRAQLTDDDGGVTEVRYDVEVTPAGPRLLAPEPPAVSEGETLTFEVEARAAEDGRGGVDGPVTMRVLRAPRGATWEEVPTPDPTASRRLRFTWPTSAGDGGAHTLRVQGTSPAGLTRALERTLTVRDTLEARLVALGGGTRAGLVSVHRYSADAERGDVALERVGVAGVGLGVGQLTRHEGTPDYLYATAPGSGVVGVVSLSTGALLRRVPVGGSPYAIASLGAHVWALDGRSGRLTAIDERLKVARQVVLRDLRGAASLMAVSVNGARRLLAHDFNGGLWLIDPEAALNNQPSRAALRAHDLNALLDRWERAQRGEEPPLIDPTDPNADPIALEAIERRGAGQLVWWEERGEVLVVHPRGVVALNPNALAAATLEPTWEIRSAAYLRALTPFEGALWATSPQGLRRFTPPAAGLVEGPDGEGELLDLNGQQTLAPAPPRLLGEPALVVGAARALSHLSAESLRPLLSTPEPNPQRLMTLELSK